MSILTIYHQKIEIESFIGGDILLKPVKTS